jgi:histidinol phosphatase-like PHP family hydrolase
VLGISEERFDAFDFIIVATTHLHLGGNTVRTKIATPEEAAFHWVDKIENLLVKDLPFRKIGIAHLACHLINKHGHLEVLDLIPDSDLERVFAKAASRGCGIELNASDFGFSDENAERVLRIFRVAKACGCKFYLGSDAHHPNQLDGAIPRFARAIDLLELTEDDKFALPKRVVR